MLVFSSTVFYSVQLVFPVSQRMFYSDHVKQRILFYYRSKRTACKSFVVRRKKDIRQAEETGTIARVPGTGQATKGTLTWRFLLISLTEL